MTSYKITRPQTEIAGYQRLSIEDIEAHIDSIRKAAEEGDDELAHSLEVKLFVIVLQKLAYRGSRIAKVALESRQVRFNRRFA